MSSLDVVIIDITAEPLKRTKRERSKEPQELAKEAAFLKYRAGLQKDVTTRMEEQSSAFLQTVSLLDEGLHLMEKDIVAAMAKFCHRLKQFKADLSCRNDERDTQDVLLQDIGVQVKETGDLKTREALFEWTESDHGKPPNASKAKGRGECRDTGDTKGGNQSSAPSTKDQILTTLYLCEEVKYWRVGSLEEEDLSESETVKSQLMLEQLPMREERYSSKHEANKEPEGTRECPAT